ncbi:aminotransferase class V-fold PLP-dependent enzyme [Lentzea alba]|uniref:pyridoxal phosphate-dependent decarboxylase family protein n=1 Tax=Lentzea alba TaxID=2714351 RepID=UPI0039BFC0A1
MTHDRDAARPLELSAEEVRALVKAATEHLIALSAKLDRRELPASYVFDSLNVNRYDEGRNVSYSLREDELPHAGTDFHVLLQQVFDEAMSNGTLHPHPGFMAHIPSGGLIQGAVGDFIARAVNRFAGVWIAAPGFQRIESNVIRWFCTMLGYGANSFGYLTTGGSLANFMAVRCALTAHEDDDRGRAVVYVSSEAHFSMIKASTMSGLRAAQVHVIGVDENYGMDLTELRSRIAADRAAGLYPVCLTGTAGTTNTGAVDDLATLARIARDEGMWFHADACFGGFFRLTERGKATLRGIEEADSISVDAHKSLFLPHGISALLVKERSRLGEAFQIPGAAYLPGFADEPELADFASYGPELSREIRGLTAWLPLKMHGVPAFAAALDEKLDLAQYLANRLSEVDGLELVRPHALQLPVVIFKLGGDQGSARNAELCELICSRGNVYLTTTELPEHGLVLRVCILHHKTDRAVVDQLIDDIACSVRTLNGGEI